MNNKVLLSNKAIKQMARQMLKGRYWSCVFAIVMAQIIVNAPVVIIGNLSSSDTLYNVASWGSTFLSVIMEYGLACFFLAVFRGRKASIENLSNAFSKTIPVVCINIISYIQIFIRTLLLIIPGIIRLIKNSQAIFVLVDNPDMRPDECIKESQRIMEGNGGKYVGLCFSFVGLVILSEIPSMLYEAYCVINAGVTVAIPSIVGVSFEQYLNEMTNYANQLAALQNPLITMALSSFAILVSAYFLTARIAFYDIASGNLILATEVDPSQIPEDREVVDLDD